MSIPSVTIPIAALAARSDFGSRSQVTDARDKCGQEAVPGPHLSPVSCLACLPWCRWIWPKELSSRR